MYIFFIERRQTPSLYRIESVYVLYREEADSFSLQKRDSMRAKIDHEREWAMRARMDCKTI